MTVENQKPSRPTPEHNRGWFQRMVRWLRWKFCRHEFRWDDLKQTGIKEQERPADNASYDEWLQWHINTIKEPAFTHGVSWPCVKCGRTFYAHCGLDILRHGKIMPPNSALCHADEKGKP